MNVVVVGGGVIGCAVAYELAARGVQVVLVDPRISGGGATHASAGMLAPYIEGHAPELLQLGVCGLEQYDGFLSRVAADASRHIEYRRTGTLQVAFAEADARDLERQAEALASSGVSARWLDGPDARRLEPALAPDVRAGLLIPQHGYVGVGTLVAALVQAGERRGVRIVMGSARVIRAAPSLRVETTEGMLAADAVVLAAGSWSACIPTDLPAPPPVRPVRGQLLHLRGPAGMLSHVVWGAGGYLVPWEDGTVLVGATVEHAGFDDSVTVAGIRELLSIGETLVPSLRDAAFEDARAGLRPATRDELPIVGASSSVEGMYYATGHYRNGVLLAPLTALMIADLLADGRERFDMHVVRPGRFGL